MPGHGERIIQTYEDWFVRINKRVQRLERRQGRFGETLAPDPQLLTNVSGFTGAIYYTSINGVVQIWSATVAGSFPVGATQVVAGANVPAEIRPRVVNRFGAAIFSGSTTGTVAISVAGNITLYQATGAARTSTQFTLVYLR